MPQLIAILVFVVVALVVFVLTGVLLFVIRLGEDPAAFRFADGLDDGRRHFHVAARDHADAFGQVAALGGAVAPSKTIDESRLPDEDLVCCL